MIKLTENGLAPVKVLGRTSKDNPYVLFYTGSRYEMNVRASYLSVVIRASFAMHEQWIAVLVDGAPMIRMPLVFGTNEILILKNRNPEREHNIRIIKETPVMPNDGDPYIELIEILTDGELLPVPEKSRKLVFIGDSITSGEGAAGAVSEEDWVSAVFSACNNYSYLTAELLDADYQAISQSGWGVLCGYDNDLRHNLPDHYKKVCSIAYADGPERPVRGAEEDYDFGRFKADAVIINLGTNDGNGLTMPPFRNPVTGEEFQMKAGECSFLSAVCTSLFCEKAVAFLSAIRCSYPNAKIFWAYGMLGNPMEPVIKTALSLYRDLTGDEIPEYIALPAATEGSFGARWHPGLPCHKQAAQVISHRLSAVLEKWEKGEMK